jgi:hypothetical protein
MAKPVFNKETCFISKSNVNLRKILVNCYIWSIVLYGAENWTHGKVDQKYF